MGRPWRPLNEIEHAIKQGNLRRAISISKDKRHESGRPIPLSLALEMLPLVARERPGEYGAWALAWLVRWSEARGATIDAAAEVAAHLAELPHEPTVIEYLRPHAQLRVK